MLTFNKLIEIKHYQNVEFCNNFHSEIKTEVWNFLYREIKSELHENFDNEFYIIFSEIIK
jgi:hypothetical protein